MATTVLGSTDNATRLIIYVRSPKRGGDPDEVLQTRNLRLVGINCDPWTAEVTFAEGREWYGCTGREALHLILSFSPSEANPDNPEDVDKALEAVRAIVEELWPGQPVMIGVQADGKGGKLHVHAVVDPVVRNTMERDGITLTPGRKLAKSFTDVEVVRRVTDEQVVAAGLTQTLEDYSARRHSPNASISHVAAHRAAEAGTTTPAMRIQQAYALGVQDPSVVDRASMLAWLSEHGVEVNDRKSGWSYREAGTEQKGLVKWLGPKKLGAYFSRDRFDELMAQKASGTVPDGPDQVQHADPVPKPVPAMSDAEVEQAQAVVDELDREFAGVVDAVHRRHDDLRRWATSDLHVVRVSVREQEAIDALFHSGHFEAAEARLDALDAHQASHDHHQERDTVRAAAAAAVTPPTNNDQEDDDMPIKERNKPGWKRPVGPRTPTQEELDDLRQRIDQAMVGDPASLLGMVTLEEWEDRATGQTRSARKLVVGDGVRTVSPKEVGLDLREVYNAAGRQAVDQARREGRTRELLEGLTAQEVERKDGQGTFTVYSMDVDGAQVPLNSLGEGYRARDLAAELARQEIDESRDGGIDSLLAQCVVEEVPRTNGEGTYTRHSLVVGGIPVPLNTLGQGYTAKDLAAEHAKQCIDIGVLSLSDTSRDAFLRGSSSFQGTKLVRTPYTTKDGQPRVSVSAEVAGVQVPLAQLGDGFAFSKLSAQAIQPRRGRAQEALAAVVADPRSTSWREAARVAQEHGWALGMAPVVDPVTGEVRRGPDGEPITGWHLAEIAANGSLVSPMPVSMVLDKDEKGALKQQMDAWKAAEQAERAATRKTGRSSVTVMADAMGKHLEQGGGNAAVMLLAALWLAEIVGDRRRAKQREADEVVRAVKREQDAATDRAVAAATRREPSKADVKAMLDAQLAARGRTMPSWTASTADDEPRRRDEGPELG